MSGKTRLTIYRVITLVGVIALILALFIFKNQVKSLANYGYIGIFLISIAANATIIIPVPGVAFTTAMGAIFNPFWVSIAAGAGAALGELSGYAAGFSGQGVAERVKLYDRMVGWMRKHPRQTYLLIALLALIPNPFFDLAGMGAGMLKLPVWKFLIPCMIGKILKMMMFAYAGYYSITWLSNLFGK